MKYQKYHAMASIVVATAIMLSSRVALAIPAADANSVLIHADTVTGGAGSNEATRAAALGYTVEVATAAQWAAATAAEFATYRALILGDPTCTGLGPQAGAEANRAVWSLAAVGNVVVVGTDPTFHVSQGGGAVTEKGIGFAASGVGTGLYVTLSCYYHGFPALTPIPLLDQFGSFTATGVPGCFNDAHIVAVHPALAGLTDATLSNWGCSVHEAIDSFPASFSPLAIAENVGGPGSLTFPDGTFGIPYIVARGAASIGCGDGVVQPPEQCDDGNTTPGDGCSQICRFESCGDGILNVGEQCDDGNTTPGDGCSATCTLESCGNGLLDPGEQCDDGNTTPGDGCSEICRFEICGDGILNVGEQCDDGNTIPGDGCSATCMLESMPTETPTGTPTGTAAATVTPTSTPTPTATATLNPFPLCEAPVSGCFQPAAGKKRILLRDKSDDPKDKVVWKWKGTGPVSLADFGSPTSTTDYTLCIYAGVAQTPVFQATAPAGGACPGGPCWKAARGNRGFRYRDRARTPDGLTRVVLRTTPYNTRAHIVVAGKGDNLPMPTLPPAQPVLAQLVKSDGSQCWEAEYSAPAIKNSSKKFEDKND